MNQINIYKYTENVFSDIKHIIDSSKKQAYQAVNIALILRNWCIGKRIFEEELHGEKRAEYGSEIIKQLSEHLQKEYGKGYTKSSLYNFYAFYKLYPDFFQTPSGKLPKLSWSHYLALIQVKEETARNWYEREALNESWSVRTLQRNINSQYYFRLLLLFFP